MSRSDYVAGIDLHGTLLDSAWQVPPALLEELTAAVEALRPRVAFYLCTGNDLSFVREHVPAPLRALFDGYVLETGCVLGTEEGERVLVPDEVQARVEELRRGLQAREFPEVRYFARRLASISLFTRTAQGGSDPRPLAPRVQEAVEELGAAEAVFVTHSDVAVDVIPRGHSKLTGLRRVAGEREIVGIADSWNDVELVLGADYAFVPANASPRLLQHCEDEGRELAVAGEGDTLQRGRVYRSASPATEAVVESLRHLERGVNA